MKGLIKYHICTTHRYRQKCGKGEKEGDVEAGWRWVKGEMRTSVIVLLKK